MWRINVLQVTPKQAEVQYAVVSHLPVCQLCFENLDGTMKCLLKLQGGPQAGAHIGLADFSLNGLSPSRPDCSPA